MGTSINCFIGISNFLYMQMYKMQYLNICMYSLLTYGYEMSHEAYFVLDRDVWLYPSLLVVCFMTYMTMSTFGKMMVSGKSLEFVGRRLWFQVNKRSRSRSLMIIIWDIEFEEQKNKHEGTYFHQLHHSCRGSNKDILTLDNNIP